MTINQVIKDEMLSMANVHKANSMAKFFQAHPGGYGEGDTFLGLTVPMQRDVSKKFFKEISLEEIEELLNEEVHEYRLTATFMLVLKYQKTKALDERKVVFDTYIKNIERINNWDLVDSSAHLVVGHYLADKERGLLYKFASSTNLWIQRISIISTFHFIRNMEFDDTLRISELLIDHKHDLIHKAVGWMLREVGNRNFEVEYNFLKNHYRIMPRTMLRYAIEKFPEEMRQMFLKGEI